MNVDSAKMDYIYIIFDFNNNYFVTIYYIFWMNSIYRSITSFYIFTSFDFAYMQKPKKKKNYLKS